MGAKGKDAGPCHSVELRRRAETAATKTKAENVKAVREEDFEKIVHELRVHQIELEMQNDELARANLEVEESRNKYYDLFDFAPVGYFTLDRKGDIRELNFAGCKLLAGQRGEIVSRNFRFFIAPEYRNEFNAFFELVYGSTIKQICELKLIAKGAPLLYAQVEGIALRNEAGDPLLCRMAVIDVTQRRQAEEILKRDKDAFERLVNEKTQELFQSHQDLERARRMSDIGRLASTIAHEIRNPLSAIKIAAHNIKKKANNPLLEKHLETINKKIIEGDQIINNLLSFVRVKSVDYEQIKIGELLRDCCRTVSGKYAHWDAPLMEDILCKEDAIIEGGSMQLRMLFSNVLDNAYQSLQEKKGTVTVSLCESPPDEFHLTITDTGVGIGPEMREKIFEPFFTTKSRGTGLGLAVCREIVDLHKGKIEIRSAQGQGTTFTITLPIRRAGVQPTKRERLEAICEMFDN